MKLYECMKTHLLIHPGRIHRYLSFTVKNWNYQLILVLFVRFFGSQLLVCFSTEYKHEKPFYPHKVLKTDKKKAVAIYTTYKQQ